MDLRHAPVVVHLAAAHRVAEMHAPVVFRKDVAEGRGCAPFGHYGVGFAEQRLADERDFGFLCACFDPGPQPGAAGANDDDVVTMSATVGGRPYNIRTS